MKTKIIVSEEDKKVFGSITTLKRYKAKAFFQEAGQLSVESAVVTKGLLKKYYVDEAGTEHIVDFIYENDFITNCKTAPNTTSTQFYIQALEPSELWVYHNNAFAELITQNPQLEKASLQILQSFVSRTQLHSIILQTKIPKERYALFCTQRRELLNRVKVIDLASYLGLSRETVSRLRSQKTIHEFGDCTHIQNDYI